jgi:MYXO-CTERM domain-containing protein
MSIRKLVIGACLALPLLSAPAVAAPTYTWTLGTSGSSSSASEMSFSASGYPSELVKVRAYSLAGTSSSNNFSAQTVTRWDGGLGVRTAGESTGSPQHATDNSGNLEFLLFEFDSANFKATGFEIGWKDTDADIQVWVGGGSAPGLNLAGSSNAACGSACNFSELSALGFVLAGTYENVQANQFQAINTNTTGRYVLIAGKVLNNDSLKDYFKLNKIKGTETTSVPEPSSMLIAGAALLGLGGFARRRRQVRT